VGRKPPGFAFIEFEDRRDADDAIRALNGICAALLFLDLLYVCNVLMIGSVHYFMHVAC
jgi:RNA recognition motif-containing protein